MGGEYSSDAESPILTDNKHSLYNKQNMTIMLEKKTMYMADFGRPQYDAESVAVIADAETGKVEIYFDNDGYEWNKVEDYHHFYATQQEAQQALEEHRRELRRLMPQVKQWIFQMVNLLDILPKKEDGLSDDEMRQKYPGYFTRKDFLPDYYVDKRGIDYEYRRAERLDKENMLLVQAATRGTLTLKGDTFRTDDVVQVRWGNERAELELTDKRTVETARDYEYNVVKYLFGGNPSGYTYARLNKNGDE